MDVVSQNIVKKKSLAVVIEQIAALVDGAEKAVVGVPDVDNKYGANCVGTPIEIHAGDVHFRHASEKLRPSLKAPLFTLVRISDRDIFGGVFGRPVTIMFYLSITS